MLPTLVTSCRHVHSLWTCLKKGVLVRVKGYGVVFFHTGFVTNAFYIDTKEEGGKLHPDFQKKKAQMHRVFRDKFEGKLDMTEARLGILCFFFFFYNATNQNNTIKMYNLAFF